MRNKFGLYGKKIQIASLIRDGRVISERIWYLPNKRTISIRIITRTIRSNGKFGKEEREREREKDGCRRIVWHRCVHSRSQPTIKLSESALRIQIRSRTKPIGHIYI